METIAALLLFVSQITNYPIPANDTPAIRFGTMGKSCWAAETNMVTGEIIIDKKEWDKGNVGDKNCMLAHELTHWLQFKNKINIYNPEPMAYKVSAACYRWYGNKTSEEWANNQTDSECK